MVLVEVVAGRVWRGTVCRTGSATLIPIYSRTSLSFSSSSHSDLGVDTFQAPLLHCAKVRLPQG